MDEQAQDRPPTPVVIAESSPGEVTITFGEQQLTLPLERCVAVGTHLADLCGAKGGARFGPSGKMVWAIDAQGCMYKHNPQS